MRVRVGSSGRARASGRARIYVFLTYIRVNVEALVAELAVGEELALLLRVIVGARTILLLGALGEELALSRGLLLVIVLSGGGRCCDSNVCGLVVVLCCGLESDVILVSGEVDKAWWLRILPGAGLLARGWSARLTFLESLEDISFRLLLLLLVLFLLPDHALEISALMLRRTLFQSALNVPHGCPALLLLTSTPIECYDLLRLQVSILDGFLS